MALRYDCKIVIEETIIPKHRDDLVCLKFFTNSYRVVNGRHYTNIDLKGKMFCYKQANALVRQLIKEDPSLLGKYYSLRMIDPNFSVKRRFGRNFSEVVVICQLLERFKPRRKPKPIEIPKCNLTDELSTLEINTADLPDFDVDESL